MTDILIILLLASAVILVIRYLLKNKSTCSGCSKTNCRLCDLNVYDEYKKDQAKAAKVR
ncbi:MAG: FeoB-associated Cys-rich membrane protein [Erysipelotrichaceae bacterium]|nr:FeoB-associated Cys-rich membrane protein [Erysipelotrichaceae bacterium]